MSGLYARIPASPEEVEAFAESLTPAYLRCRVWGHDAEPHDVDVAKDIVVNTKEGPVRVYWDAALRCSHQCGVRWRVLVGPNGEMLRRQLDYSLAPGYVSTQGWMGSKDAKMVFRKTFMVGVTGPTPQKRRAAKKATAKKTATKKTAAKKPPEKKGNGQ